VNLPEVVFNDDMNKVYLATKGYYDSIKLIDYGKFRERIVSEVFKATGFKIKETSIKNIKLTELVFTESGLGADSWIPLESSGIKIQKYIECELPYTEDTPLPPSERTGGQKRRVYQSSIINY